MPSSFSPNLRLELIANGEQTGSWGATTNTNLGTLIEGAIAGLVTVSVTSANQAFTTASGAADQARMAVIKLTTTTSAGFNVYAPPASKTYVIWNTSAHTATIYNSTVIGNTTAAGTGVAVPAGATAAVVSDGTNFVTANSLYLPTTGGTITGNLTVNGNTTLGDSSTDTVTVNGSMALRGTPASYYGLSLGASGTISGDANPRGISSSATYASDATAKASALFGQIRTTAASFTMANAIGVRLGDASKGAGSTITNLHGVYVEDQTQGTNNFGITSLVSSGTNKWNIYASGTASNYFAGNVQIGTTAKFGSETLSVFGSTFSDLATGNGIANTSYDWLVGASGNVAFPAKINIEQGSGSTSHGISFWTSNATTPAERMRIDSAGNLGLGVVPSAWNASYRTLQFGTTGTLYSSGNAAIANNMYVNSGGTSIYLTTAASSIYLQDSGQHIWYTAPSGTAGTAITFTQAMTLDAVGNLTVSPNSSGSQNEVVVVGPTDENWGGSIRFRSRNSTTVNHRIINSINGMLFELGGLERARITQGGNFLLTAGTGALGYGTGAGGTVTQATSRTTAVTLNKPCGSITMFSAAGSTTTSAFTVNNSLVAATDTIVLTVRAGSTNTYEVKPFAVTAGAFNIIFKTTGGTAVDAPIINFTIIKGATS